MIIRETHVDNYGSVVRPNGPFCKMLHVQHSGMLGSSSSLSERVVVACSTDESKADPAGLWIMIYSVSVEFNLNTDSVFSTQIGGLSVGLHYNTARPVLMVE